MKKLILCTLLASILWSVSYATEPLTVHASGKYLVGANSGTPKFLMGTAAWSMFVQIRPDSATIFMTDRKNRGFNTIMCNVYEAFFSDHAPNNIDNVAPFTSAWVAGSAIPTANDAYFKRIDSMVARADTLGLYVMMFPLYFGNPASQGLYNQVFQASTSDMQYWGHYLGGKFRKYPNIIWCIGGDASGSGTWYSQWITNTNTFVTALKDSDNTYSRVYTEHVGRQSVSSHVNNPTWLTLDAIYTGYVGSPMFNTHIVTADSAYTDAVAKPFINIEAQYENEISYAFGAVQRSQAWQSVLRGCVGYMFGNCPMWFFTSLADPTVCGVGASAWYPHLSDAGSLDMSRLDSLYTSKAWYNLVPDRAGTVITSGGGTAPNSDDICTFAYDSVGGTIIMGYLPTQRAVTISTSKISNSYSQIHSYWYNPSVGNVTEIATETKPASKTVTPPSAGDWVLVIEGTGAPVTTKPPLIIKGVSIKGAKVGS